MRWLGKSLKWLGILLFGLVLAGAAYQQIGGLIDERTVPRTGEMITVSGHGVHIDCTGSGKRTLILDAGLGAASFEWFRIQPELAKNNRVCAFDRPGLGGSDAIAHSYDGTTAADELHALIAAAHIKTPFVYVGHSLGANFAQVYAARYPADIAALVLIEPGVPADLLEDFHGTKADALAMDTSCTTICIVGWIAGELGISRLVVNHLHTGSKGFANAPEAQARYQASVARGSASGVSVAYLNALPRIAVEVTEAGTTAPVLILASAIAPPPDDGETAADMVHWRQRQLAWFAQLAGQSRHGGGPVTIPGADHTTMVTGPRARQTVRAIQAFLARL